MDISTAYNSYILPTQNIDKKKIKDLDEKKLKDVMTDFMFERLAEHMSKSSPLGLSDMIVRDIQQKSKQESSIQDESKNYQQEKLEIE